MDVAAIYNGLGDTDRAVEWLTRARQAREFDSLFVRDDPRFRNLLADPRLVRAFQTCRRPWAFRAQRLLRSIGARLRRR